MMKKLLTVFLLLLRIVECFPAWRITMPEALEGTTGFEPVRFAWNPRSPDTAGCCAQSTSLTRSYEADFTPKYAGYRRCLSAFLADCCGQPEKMRFFLPW